MKTLAALIVSVCLAASAAAAQGSKSAPSLAVQPQMSMPCVNNGSSAVFWLSGYVMLPNEPVRKVKGIEVRLMFGFDGSAASGIPANSSAITEDDGHFIFQDSAFQLAVQQGGSLFLNIRLDGYTEIFQPVNLCSSDNILTLNPGMSDGIDMTGREPLPLTAVEALREELVKQYGELAVRDYEQGLRDMLAHKMDSAIANFKKATQDAPAFYDAWMELGELQREAKHPEDAATAFEQAGKVRPAAAEPLIELGAIALDGTHYADAAATLKQATAKAPWSSDAYYYLGSAFFKLNQNAEAEDALKASLDKISPRQDARLMLVNVYIREGKYPDALDQLDQYLATVSDSPQKDAALKIQATIRTALVQPPPAAAAPIAPAATPQPVATLSVRDAALTPILERAIAYVAKYENELGNLIGNEDYVQDASWLTNQSTESTNTLSGRGNVSTSDATPKKMERRTLSDFLLIQIGPNWVPLREVNVVNGQKISNNPESFSFDDSPADNTRRFNSMKADSTKYNIGDVVREMNLPTFALEVLRRANVSRFSFDHNGNEKVGGISAWRVRFKETSGPTLVSSANGKSLFANGTLWIDPESGTVLKTEMNLTNNLKSPEIKSKVSVTYGQTKNVTVSVPSMMEEHYEYGSNIIDCKASYTNFRPFTVNVQFEPGVAPKP